MNFRRGFFRVWLLCSSLFATAVLGLGYGKIHEQFVYEAADKEMEGLGVTVIPVHCRDARGKLNADYSAPDGPWRDFSEKAECKYKLPDFRRLYPEYKDMDEDDLTRKMYEKAGITLLPKAHPWQSLGELLLMALGIPLAVLCFGWAVGWAFAGFRQA
jgi:hypothetical protein